MPVFPQPEEKRALCQLIVKYVASGPSEKPLVEYLFGESIKVEGENPPHISEQHVDEGCSHKFPTHNAISTALSRLRLAFNQFFAEHPMGRKERLRVYIPTREYALGYEINQPPPMPGDLVKAFWAPYYCSNAQTRIIYPEPLCLTDTAGNFFFANQIASLGDGIQHFSATADGQLFASFPFVQSAVVQAIVTLFQCLNGPPRTPVTASPLRPTSPFQEQDEDIIVMGTLSTLPLISELEAGCPFRTSNNSVVYRPSKDELETYKDEPNNSLANADFLTSWALLTRISKRFRSRTITLLSANSSQAIEELASFLTRPRELQLLLEVFETGDSKDTFPERFQVLFEVFIFNNPGEVKVHHVVPKRGVSCLSHNSISLKSPLSNSAC